MIVIDDISATTTAPVFDDEGSINGPASVKSSHSGIKPVTSPTQANRQPTQNGCIGR